ncbi:hypothetical protein [Kitasatospora sp. NPDC094011]|uniref:hypothetical protein n=1 Tax=Kitasatospora sp. NPDC094011 TaxID=3364090 RepID=UPI0037F2B691
MTAHQPWSIERIATALDNPALVQRFLGEINRAPVESADPDVPDFLQVFGKWQSVAERLDATRQQTDEAKAAEATGEPIPGERIDVAEKVQDAAARHRARGAA